MLQLTTAGESHGKALVALLSGMPAGLFLTEADINRDLARRQHGYGRGGRMKIESDRVEVLSGIRHGQTLGSPIALLVANRDWPNWEKIMDPWQVDEGSERFVAAPRPGHADLAGVLKFGHQDVRNVLERASARTTAADVAAGAVCRRFLQEFGVRIVSHVVMIGGIWAQYGSPTAEEVEAVDSSPLRCLDKEAETGMMALIDAAGAAGETLGGIVEIRVFGLPPGLGTHVKWDERLDGLLAQALSAVPAIKGVEFGDGFDLAGRRGSEAHDPILPGLMRPVNHAGGLEGGMSNGEPLVIRFAMKPIATLMNPLPSVDIRTGGVAQAATERSDVCAVPAAGVVGEARVAFVLAQAWLAKFGGDNIVECLRNYTAYREGVQGRV